MVITINREAVLPSKESVKYLGLQLDRRLTWNGTPYEEGGKRLSIKYQAVPEQTRTTSNILVSS